MNFQFMVQFFLLINFERVFSKFILVDSKIFLMDSRVILRRTNSVYCDTCVIHKRVSIFIFHSFFFLWEILHFIENKLTSYIPVMHTCMFYQARTFL